MVSAAPLLDVLSPPAFELAVERYGDGEGWLLPPSIRLRWVGDEARFTPSRIRGATALSDDLSFETSRRRFAVGKASRRHSLREAVLRCSRRPATGEWLPTGYR